MIAAADAREPVVICSGCGADEMGCTIKLGLSGRRCCADCGGPQSHEGGDCLEHHHVAEDLEHHHVAEDLHDQDHVDHHDRRGDDR